MIPRHLLITLLLVVGWAVILLDLYCSIRLQQARQRRRWEKLWDQMWADHRLEDLWQHHRALEEQLQQLTWEGRVLLARERTEQEHQQ